VLNGDVLTDIDLMNWKKRSDSTCTARSDRPASTRAAVVFPAPGGPVRIRTGVSSGDCTARWYGRTHRRAARVAPWNKAVRHTGRRDEPMSRQRVLRPGERPFDAARGERQEKPPALHSDGFCPCCLARGALRLRAQAATSTCPWTTLPSYGEMADERDPLCRIKLFQPGSRFTYYVCAGDRVPGNRGAGPDRLLRVAARARLRRVRRPGTGRDRPGYAWAASRSSATSTSSPSGCPRWRPTSPATGTGREPRGKPARARRSRAADEPDRPLRRADAARRRHRRGDRHAGRRRVPPTAWSPTVSSCRNPSCARRSAERRGPATASSTPPGVRRRSGWSSACRSTSLGRPAAATAVTT
jgi:hypothetical protein